MKILLTGANGYIGTRLLPRLIDEGHTVYALVRSKFRIQIPERFKDKVHVIEGDLLKPESLDIIPTDIDAAYYLVHSMSYSEEFLELESQSAKNFVKRIENTLAKQIIYLSGIANEATLSKHLTSRKQVGQILKEGKIPVTILMAGIIIGSGSASFEIIRDLVEKLPIMVAPKWLNHLTQPIGIRDVLDYLIKVLLDKRCLDQSFEIGGSDVLTYKDLLLGFAKVRKLKRKIFIVPVLTPRLSSYWLYFITSTNYSLARFLVDSLANNVVCKDLRIRKIFPKKLMSYEEALKLALARIEEDWIPSSWKDSMSGSHLNPDLSVYIQVPKFGVLKDERKAKITCSEEECLKRIWSIGGKNGWLALNWAWTIRGFIDKLLGGIGIRRGRRHPTELRAGDALDFWRVLLADEKHKRLLLYAEMRLPGEAWLEFKIVNRILYQTATFRPTGLFGRFYWYFLYPIHVIIFRLLAKKLARKS